MENSIQIFNNPEFGEMRTTLSEDNEPLFNANDVCNALGHSNYRDAVIRHCEDGDVVKRDTLTEGGVQLVNYVNESGLYSLIFGSKLPKAKEFKHWVTSEVLPSIRKTGGYIQANEAMSDAEIMAKALLVAQSTIERRDQKIRELSAKVEHDAPKVASSEAITASKGSCLISELAKTLTQNGITIGQNRLFRWLRHNGFLGSQGGYYNVPMQEYVERGIFEIRRSYHMEGDETVSTITPLITTKGQQYFINGFLSERFSLSPAGGK